MSGHAGSAPHSTRPQTGETMLQIAIVRLLFKWLDRLLPKSRMTALNTYLLIFSDSPSAHST